MDPRRSGALFGELLRKSRQSGGNPPGRVAARCKGITVSDVREVAVHVNVCTDIIQRKFGLPLGNLDVLRRCKTSPVESPRTTCSFKGKRS